METNHQVTLSRADIERIAARLPQRVRRRFESDSALTDLAAEQPSLEEVVADQERAVTASRLEAALNAAMAGLDSQDRLIFELRFREGRTVAEIARALRLDQKALYRRVDRSLAGLLTALQAAGIDKEQALKIFESAAVSFEWREYTKGTLRPGPSPEKGEREWS